MPSLVIARNQSSGQNLVESTKLKRFPNDPKTVLLKEERKERRKHKKEKREKPQKRKHKKEKREKPQKAVKKHLLPSKKPSDESDQLEKSDLTGEFEGPQNQLGYLSDGSQTSKKRKRDASPPPVESLIKAAPVAGKPLRIRLIFKKPKVESSSLPREDIHACSTSGAESLNHRDKAAQAVVTSSVPKVCEPDSKAVITSSVPKVCEPELNVPAAIDETKKKKKHKPSREDRYNALFDDWTPPSSICFPAMDVDPSKDDDDWLFGNRTRDRINDKAAVKIDEDANMSLQRSSDSSWPKAQFLSHVGIYSLPYTVPF